jgi:protein-disulfide isomerase
MLRWLVVTSVAALVATPALSAQDPLSARTKGRADAPVTVYEMSDFQCPFCRRFTTETFPALEKEYIATGKVRWIFVNFPIPQLHPNAVAAAEFAMCSARQGKFWEAHDRLYAEQERWAPLKDPGQYFVAMAGPLKLDQARLVSCLKDGATRTAIQQDAQGAVRAGAGATPAFYIEGGMMEGAQPTSVFRMVLDSIIKAKKG